MTINDNLCFKMSIIINYYCHAMICLINYWRLPYGKLIKMGSIKGGSVFFAIMSRP